MDLEKHVGGFTHRLAHAWLVGSDKERRKLESAFPFLRGGNMDDYEMYHPYETNAFIRRCPCCQNKARLWSFSESFDGPTTKVVACEQGEPLGPREEGCVLFMPPDDFYRATAREAVDYWNRFCVAISLQSDNAETTV